MEWLRLLQFYVDAANMRADQTWLQVKLAGAKFR